MNLIFEPSQLKNMICFTKPVFCTYVDKVIYLIKMFLSRFVEAKADSVILISLSSFILINNI
ncbi:hypothetical protein JCM10914_5522 [Paenibacillus sp. JCM 10914]|nr:hypothetical protein JCM10914_5522 [Paenibacillus sp. JCM 10914]